MTIMTQVLFFLLFGDATSHSLTLPNVVGSFFSSCLTFSAEKAREHLWKHFQAEKTISWDDDLNVFTMSGKIYFRNFLFGFIDFLLKLFFVIQVREFKVFRSSQGHKNPASRPMLINSLIN